MIEFAQTEYTAFSEEEVIFVEIRATPPPDISLLVELRLVSDTATGGRDCVCVCVCACACACACVCVCIVCVRVSE